MTMVISVWLVCLVMLLTKLLQIAKNLRLMDAIFLLMFEILLLVSNVKKDTSQKDILSVSQQLQLQIPQPQIEIFFWAWLISHLFIKKSLSFWLIYYYQYETIIFSIFTNVKLYKWKSKNKNIKNQNQIIFFGKLLNQIGFFLLLVADISATFFTRLFYCPIAITFYYRTLIFYWLSISF
jgi:hypothetical protein